MDEIINILLEGMTFQEKDEYRALTEAAKSNVSSSLVHKLYDSVLNKGHVDFGDIPNSKGDITKYKGYKNMKEVLGLLREVAQESKIAMEDVDVVEQSITIIITYKDIFNKGFMLEKGFIQITYNNLVLSCVEATSLLISSYVDFVKSPDKLEFELVNIKSRPQFLAIKNLAKFNMAVKSGEFSKSFNYIIKSGVENFTGGEVVVPMVIIGGIATFIPIMRELIFYYYYSRMSISDFLKHQADLIEIRKAKIESDEVLTAPKKKSILSKQEARIKTLMSLSDKISVNHQLTNKKSMKDLQQENKSYTLKNVKPDTEDGVLI